MGTIGFFGGKFSPVHNGHVNAILHASTQVDVLHVAVITDEQWEREHLYTPGASRIPFFGIRQRVRWLRTIFKDFDHIKVHGVHQPETGDADADWAAGAREVWGTIGEPIDLIFSSEPHYGEFFKKLYPDAEHVLIDPPRGQVPVSATRIRDEGAMACWDFLPAVVPKM